LHTASGVGVHAITVLDRSVALTRAQVNNSPAVITIGVDGAAPLVVALGVDFDRVTVATRVNSVHAVLVDRKNLPTQVDVSVFDTGALEGDAVLDFIVVGVVNSDNTNVGALVNIAVSGALVELVLVRFSGSNGQSPTPFVLVSKLGDVAEAGALWTVGEGGTPGARNGLRARWVSEASVGAVFVTSDEEKVVCVTGEGVVVVVVAPGNGVLALALLGRRGGGPVDGDRDVNVVGRGR